MAHKLSNDISSLQTALGLLSTEVIAATGQLKARLRVIETRLGNAITSLTRIDLEIDSELDAEKILKQEAIQARQTAQQEAVAARQAEKICKKFAKRFDVTNRRRP